jgi:hypothetical protein
LNQHAVIRISSAATVALIMTLATAALGVPQPAEAFIASLRLHFVEDSVSSLVEQ